MTRKEFETAYLGKCVEVTTFDGRSYRGHLRKTGTEFTRDDPNLYLIQNYYYIEFDYGISTSYHSTLYRKSHFKKIRLVNESIIV